MPLLVAAANAPVAEKAKADRVCDGVDDHVDIQWAIDSARSVRLSEGDFWIAAPVRHHALVDVGGAGEERTRVFQVPGPAFDPWVSGAYPAAGDCYRASLHDLTISGISNGDPQFGYGTVVFRGGEFCRFERLAIRNMQGTGLLLMACPYATVRDILVENNNVDGFCAYDGSSYLDLGPAVARNNRSFGFLILGMENMDPPGQAETTGWKAHGLIATGNAQGIGVLSGARRGLIWGCHANSNSGPGFLFRSDALPGGTLGFVSDVSAFGCSAAYNGGAGFRADGNGASAVDDLALSDCRAQDNGWGFDIEAHARNTVLRGIYHRGNTSGGIRDDGQGTMRPDIVTA